MNSTPCQPEILLNASTCEIQYCPDCEMIHLMMGSMVLRIPTEQFKELTKDLGKGLSQLNAYKRSSAYFSERSSFTLHS
ncbi:MAG: hypothetical protein HFP81_01370 [Methylococcales symbiont of Hymedesmia sp. n. MRB-2018]|nr:MAG: hypothetical protein HFP78_03460 [Methylococcales symbiont of Hymedesmia sp. n. MRB-2018]KAF3984592.1 MAG: hypothetical protein HFP81_01370 [Methylococcales symbiont of Hymedesmia sp. n. MRB-2018]